MKYTRARRKQRAEACKRWRNKLKIEVFGAYGGKCVDCGIEDLTVLELHHVNHDGKAQRRLHGRGSDMWRYFRRAGYPPCVETLCSNCHKRRHSEKP